MTKEELFALAESKHDIKIGHSIDEGFKIFKKNIGGFLGITVINLMVSSMMGMIPFVGHFLSYFVSAFFSAGMIIVCKKVRNEEGTQFDDFFLAFKTNPGQFILLLIVQFSMILAVAVPAIIVFFARYYDKFLNGGTPNIEMLYSIIPLMLFVLIPVLFLSICYTFTFYIYLFINQDFWTAMEASRKVVMKNFFPILGLLIIIGLLSTLGIIFTCGLGYFAIPSIITAVIYVVFDDVFKPTANAFDTKIDEFGSFQKDLNTEAEEKNL